MIREDFAIEHFHPARLFRNPHFQTVGGSMLRPTTLEFERVRVDTLDDDFIDMDIPIFTDIDLPDDAPVVLALHGLEGSARRGYMQALYRELALLGIRSVGMNYRTCSGEMNRTATLYHAGKTDDVALAHRWTRERFPYVPFGMVGFSLGGSLLLKYLGEYGDACTGDVLVGAAISPPFNFHISFPFFQHASGRYYARLLLRSLKRKIKLKRAQLEGVIDMKAALRARTLKQFDERVTVPLHGFRDVSDYYEWANCEPYIDCVRIPVLILRSLDDPFFSTGDIPYELLAQHPYLYPHFTQYGGHVGFIEGMPGRWRFWAERQAARWVSAWLQGALQTA